MLAFVISLCSAFSWLATLGAALAVLAGVLIIFADADLSLLFASKFGKQPDSLHNKVVWISGASSGIGRQRALPQ